MSDTGTNFEASQRWEGRASSRPLSDGRMSGYPVVPMVDDPMKARCRGNAALHLALGGAGILHAAVTRERDHLMGGAASSRAPPRPLPKCASV